MYYLIPFSKQPYDLDTIIISSYRGDNGDL